MNKICTKCHVEKPIECFVKDKRISTGYGSYCTECKKRCFEEYKKTDKGKLARKETLDKYNSKPDVIERAREYAKLPKSKQKRKEYAQTEKGKEVIRKSRKKYKDGVINTPEYRQKRNAQNAVLHAREKGIIPAQNTLKCLDCGKQARDYHHHLGYDECHWLDVIPLCKTCHNLRHIK